MTPDINPEPVPSASQLAVLPFLAAVEGFLGMHAGKSRYRTTLHRIMSWEGMGYFQQLCTYLGSVEKNQRDVGRMLPVTTGIIGVAFEKRRVYRTRAYKTEEDLSKDLEMDMKATKDPKKRSEVGWSYLAVPFLGPDNQVVMVLYGECFQFNFFANNSIVDGVCAMSEGFCRLFDWLQGEPLPNLRNFPLQKGEPIKGPRTVYARLQEGLDRPVPRFHKLTSFNYEASVD